MHGPHGLEELETHPGQCEAKAQKCPGSATLAGEPQASQLFSLSLSLIYKMSLK